MSTPAILFASARVFAVSAFEERFKEEISVSQPAQKKLEELKKLAETNEVTLFCYEKKETTCHRRILKEIIER